MKVRIMRVAVRQLVMRMQMRMRFSRRGLWPVNVLVVLIMGMEMVVPR